jgi:hypothetical protein
MFLVLVPLLFHSYTGTALRFPVLYHLLYWGTLVAILAHVLALSLVNPESLEAIIPLDSASSNSANGNNATAIHELRRIWYVLLLSLVSNVCHLVMLLHVRSTGPYQHPLLRVSGGGGGGTKQPSVYFTLRAAAENVREPLFHRSASSNGQHSPHPAEAAIMNAMNGTFLWCSHPGSCYACCGRTSTVVCIVLQ